MDINNFYNSLKTSFNKIIEENNLLNEEIIITGKVLTTEEAIGNPERQDYPIIKGKEKLLQAEFKGHYGQAFTDMPYSYKGTLKDIVNMPLTNNFKTAVYIATINAVCSYLGITDKTIHCKNEEPEKCALELVSYISNNYGNPKIALIGLQPAMLQALSKEFSIRVVDLDEDNIDKEKFGVLIENGFNKTDDLLDWCDIIVATGSTIANNTITKFIIDKPAIFFGTTIAGAAKLMNLQRFCYCSK